MEWGRVIVCGVVRGNGGEMIADRQRCPTLSVPASPTLHTGDVVWTPVKYAVFLWQIGQADRMGGEFNLGNAHREWFLPGRVRYGAFSCCRCVVVTVAAFHSTVQTDAGALPTHHTHTVGSTQCSPSSQRGRY